MESVVLKLLDFKVAVPTINWFCEHFLQLADDMNTAAKDLAFVSCKNVLVWFALSHPWYIVILTFCADNLKA